MDLFAPPPPDPEARSDRPPLAERMRPQTLEEVAGHTEITGEGGLLQAALSRRTLPSLIFWGPPGCGKTTLARILAREAGLPFRLFSAVTGGVKEVRAIVAEAKDRLRRDGETTVLFVDEIHRFNKSQQDAFLPHIESGTIVLLGATTENPSFELNSALLSRAQVVVLEAPGTEAVVALLERALADAHQGLGDLNLTATPEALERIARAGHGDVRAALNLLETSALLAEEGELRAEHVERAALGRPLHYDKRGDQHYDVISAFIKSMRGTDPDAALYYLARMLEGGEDPKFIARRMVIFASEDVGNAEPLALDLSISVARAVEFVGLPEARINLAQGVTFLALAPKSNASYEGINRAQAAVQQHGPLPVPKHLRNAVTGLMKQEGYGSGYQYAHQHAGGVSGQTHLPEALGAERFYEPTDRGLERELARRLERLRELRGS